jgi:tartrate dehydratase alpha subunit/fumarate hydratase class I-like protein
MEIAKKGNDKPNLTVKDGVAMWLANKNMQKAGATFGKVVLEESSKVVFQVGLANIKTCNPTNVAVGVGSLAVGFSSQMAAGELGRIADRIKAEKLEKKIEEQKKEMEKADEGPREKVEFDN